MHSFLGVAVRNWVGVYLINRNFLSHSSGGQKCKNQPFGRLKLPLRVLVKSLSHVWLFVSPWIVAYRDWTWVSHTAGRLFTVWATRQGAKEGVISGLSWLHGGLRCSLAYRWGVLCLLKVFSLWLHLLPFCIQISPFYKDTSPTGLGPSSFVLTWWNLQRSHLQISSHSEVWGLELQCIYLVGYDSANISSQICCLNIFPTYKID